MIQESGGRTNVRWKYDTRRRKIVDYQDDSSGSDASDEEDYSTWSGVKRSCSDKQRDDDEEDDSPEDLAWVLHFSDEQEDKTPDDESQQQQWTNGNNESIARRERAGLTVQNIPDDDDAAVLVIERCLERELQTAEHVPASLEYADDQKMMEAMEMPAAGRPADHAP